MKITNVCENTVTLNFTIPVVWLLQGLSIHIYIIIYVHYSVCVCARAHACAHLMDDWTVNAEVYMFLCWENTECHFFPDVAKWELPYPWNATGIMVPHMLCCYLSSMCNTAGSSRSSGEITGGSQRTTCLRGLHFPICILWIELVYIILYPFLNSCFL
jgi:hypothetical protein